MCPFLIYPCGRVCDIEKGKKPSRLAQENRSSSFMLFMLQRATTVLIPNNILESGVN